MRRARTIVGPTLFEFDGIGLTGARLDIATAYYSRRAIEAVSIGAATVRFMVRLDLNTTDDWERGYVAPDAILAKARRLKKSGSEVTLLAAPLAHAKVYVGDKAAMIGSANLTLRGFGGGLEIVYKIPGAGAVRKYRKSLDAYASLLEEIDLDKLEQYVEQHRERIGHIHQNTPPLENRLPADQRDAIFKVGDYSDFLDWLTTQEGEAADEIYQRAKGKHQLSGHIHRNFYGLRQFFLAHPELQKRFQSESPDKYKLSADTLTEQEIARFVQLHASDEGNFSLDTWKTYLPEECGGRAGKHGGTIGNLNMMLPQVARYLSKKRGK